MFWYVILPALIIAGIATASAFIFTSRETYGRRHDSDGGPGVAAGITFIGTLVLSILLNWLIIGGFNPRFAHPFDMGWPIIVGVDLLIGAVFAGITSLIGSYDEVPTGAVLPGGLLVLLLIGQLLGPTVLLSPRFICDNPAYNKLASILPIEDMNSVYPDTDLNHIIEVSEQTALQKAQRGLTNEGGYSTWLQVNTAYLQRVGDRYYWIVDLKVTNLGGYNTNGQTLPGYIAVDAQDPNLEAEQHFGYKMHLSPNSWAFWSTSLDREVYFNYLLPRGEMVSDLDGLEVDDNWNPFYTGSVVRYAEGITGRIVDHIIVIDPQQKDFSKALTSYSLENKPAWVDRVWSEQLVKDLVNWWGGHSKHEDCQLSADQKKVDDIHDLVTHEGFVYQITMTSVSNDQSVTDLLYVSPTTGRGKRYNLTGATAVAVEHLIEEASHSKNSQGFDATSLQVHMVFGEPVWYAILLGRSADNKESAGSSAGFSFVRASHTTENTDVIIAQTLTEAYNQLRREISIGDEENPDIGNQQQVVQYTGTLDRKGSLVTEDGVMYYIFTLRNTDAPVGTLFRAPATLPVAALMKEGDKLIVTAFRNTIDNYVDVNSIIDESLKLPRR